MTTQEVFEQIMRDHHAMIHRIVASYEAGPAVVRFYDGDPTQGGQQIGVDQTVSLAGCGSNTIAAVQWANVGPGLHQVYVVVDATNAIAETNEANNIQSFPVLVGTQRAFTPRIAR